MSLHWDYSGYFEGLDQYGQVSRDLMLAGARKIGADGWGRMIEAAPIMTGHLRGTASVHVNGKAVKTGPWTAGSPGRGGPVDGILIVWGFNAFYAAKVHENPNAGRKAGGPWYVSKILISRQYAWMKFLADFIRAGLRRRGLIPK